MVTYYTAIGRFDSSSDKQIPSVIRRGKAHKVDAPEFILWSSVLWNIYNYEELKKVYWQKIKEARLNPDFDFDYYLALLESRELIAVGKGYTAVAAIYSMLSKLYICPINCSFLEKIGLFIKLSIKKVPVGILVHLFDRDKIENDEEEKVWNIANQTILSVSEAIWCVENGIEEISEDNMVQRIYGEKYDYKTIGAYAQMHDSEYKIINAIANLYLKKMLIWEM